MSIGKSTIVLIILSVIPILSLARKVNINEKDTSVVAGERNKDVGRLTGSFETNTILYLDDSSTGAIPPKDHYGSNNYLKLDYQIGKFTTGIQAEYYPQVLQGYESALIGFRLPEKYVSWTDKYFTVTAGDFYEQFGSGLLFRSWEDRTLGFNNSIGGGRITFNAKNYVQGKIIYGFPRNYMGKGQNWADTYTDTQIFGGDFSLSLSNVMGFKNHSVSLEGGVLYRLENSIPEFYDGLGFNLDKGNLSYSARISYEIRGFSFKGEYVGKGEDLYLSPKTFDYELRSGNAQYVELNYSGSGLSVSGMFRRLDNMRNLIYRTVQTPLLANTLNYLPALSPQHTYMLAVINPYTPYIDGEMGGQIDVFYLFKKNTKFGGKRGWMLHGNFSLYYSLSKAVERDMNPFLYRDITIDVEKSWSRKLKTILYATIQEYAADHGSGASALTVVQNVFVADIQYKFTPTNSLRGEFQYLYSEEATKDWIAGMLELSIGPKWNVFVGDMYNHGDAKVHYYSMGVSFSHSILRVSLNYGRNRAGFVCSGGVCRYQPAYTGGNLSISLLF